MVCPLCGRLYCDHSPAERGQTTSEMLEDMVAPHIIGEDGRTRRVSEEEYDDYMGKPRNYKGKTEGKRSYRGKTEGKGKK